MTLLGLAGAGSSGPEGVRGKAALEPGESCSLETEPGYRERNTAPIGQATYIQAAWGYPLQTSQTGKGQGINVKGETGMLLAQEGRKTRQTFIT